MYARKVDQQELTFDFAWGLKNNNLVFVDRETSSVWSQLTGGAVDGPLRGKPLQTLPMLQTTWAHWRDLHPQTRVMKHEPKEPGEPRPPYRYTSRKVWEPLPEGETPSEDHDTSTLGLGLVRGGKSVFYPFRELAKLDGPIRVTHDKETWTVHYKADAFTAWATGAHGALLPAVLAYESNWRDFQPESEFFRKPE